MRPVLRAGKEIRRRGERHETLHRTQRRRRPLSERVARRMHHAWLVPFAVFVVPGALGHSGVATAAFSTVLFLWLVGWIVDMNEERKEHRRDAQRAAEALRDEIDQERPKKGEAPRKTSWWLRRATVFRDWPDSTDAGI